MTVLVMRVVSKEMDDILVVIPRIDPVVPLGLRQHGWRIKDDILIVAGVDLHENQEFMTYMPMERVLAFNFVEVKDDEVEQIREIRKKQRQSQQQQAARIHGLRGDN